ncbi:hypothetical protein JHW43_002706 [Diplocarpon mali]|nr:hypothetical protein JHW43_002706 [Diplocarpon mali]
MRIQSLAAAAALLALALASPTPRAQTQGMAPESSVAGTEPVSRVDAHFEALAEIEAGLAANSTAAAKRDGGLVSAGLEHHGRDHDGEASEPSDGDEDWEALLGGGRPGGDRARKMGRGLARDRQLVGRRGGEHTQRPGPHDSKGAVDPADGG